jgi:hypothetical protein
MMEVSWCVDRDVRSGLIQDLTCRSGEAPPQATDVSAISNDSPNAMGWDPLTTKVRGIDRKLLFGISRERSIRQQLNNDKARVLL